MPKLHLQTRKLGGSESLSEYSSKRLISTHLGNELHLSGSTVYSLVNTLTKLLN